MIILIKIVVGLLLLIFGRQLFWIFVGGLGFVIGLRLSPLLINQLPLNDYTDWLPIVIALAFGVAGAILGIFLQRVAVGVAGFVAGGYLILSLIHIMKLSTGSLTWLPVLVGAIIGAVVMLTFFDWALIFLSSLIGATLISQTVYIGLFPTILLFLIMLMAGISIQINLLYRDQTRSAS